MAAPGGLLFAKIIKPETDTPDDNIADDIDGGDDKLQLTLSTQQQAARQLVYN